jgi:hypothetical protein
MILKRVVWLAAVVMVASCVAGCRIFWHGEVCTSDAECDDGLFCNGIEVCGDRGTCPRGDPPCEHGCDEELDECLPECVNDGDCVDGSV